MALQRAGDPTESRWLYREQVALQRVGGSTESRWLYREQVALQRVGGSTESRWLYREQVALQRAGHSMDWIATSTRSFEYSPHMQCTMTTHVHHH